MIVIIIIKWHDGHHNRLLVLFLPDGYAMLMRPNKAETAVHGCHCLGDMAVRMRKVLAGPWVDRKVSRLLINRITIKHRVLQGFTKYSKRI